MDKITFSKDLLSRYLDNTCSEEEKALVEGWYNQQLKANNLTIDEEDLQKREDQALFAIRNFKENLNPVPVYRKIKSWQIISGIAASIVVVLLFNHLIIGVKPKINKQTLNTVLTSAKEKNLIQLPDGSTVILDMNTRISYPKSFSGKKLREVYLSGKAFFDIKHNSFQPFIVHSGLIKTTVLGTAFDISASPGSDEIIVSVIRGKVNVSTKNGNLGNLLPNKRLIYHIKSDQSMLSNLTSQKEMKWTKEDMLLNDISFEAICEQLEKRYHVKINIADDILKNKKFTISLTENEELNGFLKTICDFNEATYTYNNSNNTYTITKIN